MIELGAPASLSAGNRKLGPVHNASAGISSRLRIVIADDHPLFRRGLREAAAMACGDPQIDEVETLAELQDMLASSDDIALVLLDLRLPDCSGFGGLHTIREAFPATPVAIVSAIDDDVTIRSAIEYGAMGFIPKSTRINDLVEALATISAGDMWTPPTRDDPPLSVSPLARASLTPAQLRILSCLQRGLINKQIAYELGVTEYTVKAHMSAAFRKLGVANRTQALVLLRDDARTFG